MRDRHPQTPPISAEPSAPCPPVALSLDQRFKILAEIGQLVAEVGENEADLVLRKILETVCTVTQAKGGSVFLVDYPANEIILLQRVGEAINDIGVVHRRTDSAPFSREELIEEHLAIQSVSASDGRTLTWLSLRIGSNRIGILCIVSALPLELDEEDATLLRALASQASLVIDRTGTPESEEVSRAFANIFQASQLLHSAWGVKSIHQTIADNALRLSQADFVVLYEYFEKKHDVRIPPIVAGEMKAAMVLANRGEVVAHRSSAVFRLLQHDKPFYAPRGYKDWQEHGLIDEGVGEDRSFFQRELVMSSAGIPLRIDAEKVGVLFFNYRTEVPFSRRIQKRLELFSKQAALALGNARYFERAERYSQKLKLLQEIGRQLSFAVNLGTPEILDALHQHVRRVIPSENFFLCLYNEDHQRLELPYLKDERDLRENLLPGLNKGLAAYVRETGKPLLAREEDINRLISQGKAERVGTSAKVWLGAPMITRERVIGVIVVQDYENEDAFDSEDLELLSLIASQAAVTVDNHRLFTEFKHQVDELSALLKLSQEIGTGRLALSSLLSSVLDQACQLAGCDGSLLSLQDPGGTGSMRVIAASQSLQHLLGETIESGEGVIGRVADEGDYLIINHYEEWPGRSKLFQLPPKRVCGVPLLWREKVFGVMTLASNDEGMFSKREVQLLKRLAGPLAIAIHNAHNSSFRRCLIHGSPHAIVAADTEGRVTELSDAAESLFKYTREELIGEMVRTLYWGKKKDREKIGDQIQQAGNYEGVLFGKTKRGEKIPLSVSASLLRDQDGEILGSMGIVEDLRLGSLRGRTRDLVKALGEINLAEELDKAYELIAYHSSDLLYGDAACLFVRKGDRFETQTSLGADENCLEEWQALPAQKLIYDYARQERVGRPLSVEELDGLCLTRQSRSAIPAPICVANRLLALLWIESREFEHFREDQELLQTLVDQAAQSISRLILLQEREKTLQRLITTSNAISIGQIATGFLHETKNSLNGMTLSVLDLQEDLQREPHLQAKSEYTQQLEEVLAEMKRLDDLARRLQGFTRQGLFPTRQEAYLNEIVERTFELLASTLDSKKLRHEMRLDSALDRPAEGKGNPILVDEAQLQQVFMNLILNAVAASPARSRLTIETRNNSNQVEFRLIDQGRGISDAERSQIFEPFFTTKDEGTGLGLYISKILIEENHQGRIEVISSPGKGSTFCIIIPKQMGGRKQ